MPILTNSTIHQLAYEVEQAGKKQTRRLDKRTSALREGMTKKFYSGFVFWVVVALVLLPLYFLNCDT